MTLRSYELKGKMSNHLFVGFCIHAARRSYIFVTSVNYRLMRLLILLSKRLLKQEMFTFNDFGKQKAKTVKIIGNP